MGALHHAKSTNWIYYMVYYAEAVLPCDRIHDVPRIHMYEAREAELDWQDALDALEEEFNISQAHFTL